MRTSCGLQNQNRESMKKDLLLPYGFKKIGWAILIPALLAGILRITLIDPDTLFGWLHIGIRSIDNCFTNNAEQWVNTVLILCIVAGAVLVACSRERTEDEMTVQIRLRTLMSALYIYCGAVILITLFVYDIAYVVWMTYAMLGFILVFLTLFRWQLWRLRKEADDEE